MFGVHILLNTNSQ